MTNLNHELRAKGIGSSEIAMLVIDDEGHPLSPWGGPHKLWRIKTGVEIPDDSPKQWLSRGNALEPWLLACYAEDTGARLRKSPGTIQHKKFPYVVDSVDAIAWMPGDGKRPSTAVEAKAPLPFTMDEWSDGVPAKYMVQGQWHMGVWSLPKCDYPIDAYGKVKIFSTTNDEELWMSLVTIAEKFWVDHVESGVPPPVDATEETSQWLSRRLKQKDQDLVDADDETVKKMLRWRELKLAHDKNKEELELLGNEIKAAIGEHKGICIPDKPKLKLTFTEVGGRSSFDHEAYIMELLRRYLPEDAAPPDRNEYQKTGTPYRRFNTKALLKGEI